MPEASEQAVQWLAQVLRDAGLVNPDDGTIEAHGPSWGSEWLPPEDAVRRLLDRIGGITILQEWGINYTDEDGNAVIERIDGDRYDAEQVAKHFSRTLLCRDVVITRWRPEQGAP